jgi:hypothetical protein
MWSCSVTNHVTSATAKETKHQPKKRFETKHQLGIPIFTSATSPLVEFVLQIGQNESFWKDVFVHVGQ